MTSSLKEFAQQRPGKRPGPPCWLCNLPERAEVEDARASGVQLTTIQRWLVEEKGYPVDQVNYNRLRGHFTNLHHER